MGLIQKIRNFTGLQEAEKVQLDRRAFLRGMTVTAAGLLVPKAGIVDMGRRIELPRPQTMRLGTGVPLFMAGLYAYWAMTRPKSLRDLGAKS